MSVAVIPKPPAPSAPPIGGGPQWIDAVPTGWVTRRLKTVLVRNDGGVWGDAFDPDGTIVLRSTEQTVGGEWQIEDPARRALSATDRAAGLLRTGDLVLTKSSGSMLHIGKTSIVTPEVAALRCCFSNFMQRLRCDSLTEPRFVFYILNSVLGREQMAYGSNSSTGLANLSGSIVGSIQAAFPPLPKQRAIAAWLDERTKRIDELAAAKKRLIDLLAEKQVAEITRAVTQGVRRGVAMKPSLIEYYPDIPDHWTVRPLKCFSNLRAKSFIDGDWIEAPYVTDQGIRLIQCGNIGTGEYIEQGYRFISEETFEELACTPIGPGDVLICRMRSSARILAGRACLAPALGERMVTAVDNCIVKCAADVDARYLVYLLSSKAHLEFVEAIARGGTRDRISRSMLGSVRLPCPPLSEQREIADHLDRACERYKALSEKSSEAIDKLHEYRQAVITAAVTGKIDVIATRSERQAEHSEFLFHGGVAIEDSATGREQRSTNKHFQRTVLAAEIIASIGDKPTFGRVKLQKAMVLAEYHLRLDQIRSEPVRAAAGPFDNQMMQSIHAQLKRSQWYDYNQAHHSGKYGPLTKAGGHKQYFNRYWADRQTEFHTLMGLLKPMTTEQAEIVATLYAAWNDFLIDGKAVGDDEIIREVLTNWDPSKQAIPETKWRKALSWMRDKGLVPTGYGAHTKPGSSGKHK